MDGTKVSLKWPRQAGNDPSIIATNIKNALEADKIMLELGDHLMVIPMRNVKYFQISPPPPKLPNGVLKGAQIVI